jgi:hypothetical protein
MVFGLMAFSASAAQAETGAKWLILDVDGTHLSNLEASVGLEVDTDGVLHSEISKTKVLFECKTIAAENAVLKTNGSIGEGAKLKFTGCITKLNGVTSGACVPKAGGTETGVIKTQPGHGLLVLHELAGGVKDDLVKILPDTGETFAFIEMPECSIGTKVPVIGKATLKDCQDLALEHLVKHLVETGPLTELWTISKTAEHVATILGSAWAFLTGTHEGLKFSGDPF